MNQTKWYYDSVKKNKSVFRWHFQIDKNATEDQGEKLIQTPIVSKCSWGFQEKEYDEVHIIDFLRQIPTG